MFRGRPVTPILAQPGGFSGFGSAQMTKASGDIMKNCWELKDCGREAGGRNVAAFGECITSQEGLGHSCWAIAGTLCGGEVQGSVKDKHENCLICNVYQNYNRMTGTMAQDVAVQHPDEDRRYREVLRHR